MMEPKLFDEEEVAAAAAPSGGKGGGGGGMAGMLGGGTNVISNVADTAMKIYMAKKQREEEEKKYKHKLQILGQQNLGDAAQSAAQSELGMNNMMSQAFMRSLLGR